MFKLCVKFEQNRTIRCRVIDDLAINFPGGGISKHYSSEERGPNSTKFGESRAVSSPHQIRNFRSDVLLRFEMTSAQKWAMLSDAEKDAKFSTLWPPVKIRGGVGEISELRFLALPRTEPRV